MIEILKKKSGLDGDGFREGDIGSIWGLGFALGYTKGAFALYNTHELTTYC